jgi:hypothetical protein
MARRIQSACGWLLFVAVAWHVPPLAAPTTDEGAAEVPGSIPMKPPPHKNWYGMCNAPQGGEAYPTHPVLVVAAPCENYQEYVSIGMGEPYSSCGGYTVAFGQQGNLKWDLNRITLRAEWGDDTLTQAQCSKAKITAVAWGARCPNDVCKRGGDSNWELIGTGPTQRSGTWNSVSNACYISANFNSANKKYMTLNLDIIATLEESGRQVRKYAKGTIHAGYPNGKCISLPVKTATK